MDAINRRVAMQNLFSFAKENPELQFIFLSPQVGAPPVRACGAAGGISNPVACRRSRQLCTSAIPL